MGFINYDTEKFILDYKTFPFGINECKYKLFLFDIEKIVLFSGYNFLAFFTFCLVSATSSTWFMFFT